MLVDFANTLLPDVENILKTDDFNAEWPSFSGAEQEMFNRLYNYLYEYHGILLWEDIQKVEWRKLDEASAELLSKNAKDIDRQALNSVMDLIGTIVKAKNDLHHFFSCFNELLTSSFTYTESKLSHVKHLCGLSAQTRISINNSSLFLDLTKDCQIQEAGVFPSDALLSRMTQIISAKAIQTNPRVANIETSYAKVKHEMAKFYAQMKTEVYACHSTALHNYGKLMTLSQAVRSIQWPEKIEAHFVFSEESKKALEVNLVKLLLPTVWNCYTSSFVSHIPELEFEARINGVNNNSYMAAWLDRTDDSYEGAKSSTYMHTCQFRWISKDEHSIMSEEIANQLFDRLDINKIDLLYGKDDWNFQQLKAPAPEEIQKYRFTKA